MSASNFEQLCAGFCEFVRIPSPELSPDASGAIGFHIDWNGVTANIMYVPAQSRELAFIGFELGDIDLQHPDAALTLCSLLQANFLPLRTDPPTFAINPATGGAVLQCMFPVLDAQPQALLNLIEEGVNLALQWRRDFSLQPDSHAAHAAAT